MYVDTASSPDGLAQADFGRPEQRSRNEQRVAEQGDGWRYPLSAWDEFGEGNQLDGLSETERALMRGRANNCRC